MCILYLPVCVFYDQDLNCQFFHSCPCWDTDISNLDLKSAGLIISNTSAERWSLSLEPIWLEERQHSADSCAWDRHLAAGIGLGMALVRGLITQLLRMPAVHTQACLLHTGLCTARPELSQSPGLQEIISWIRVSHTVLYSQSLKIWAQNRTSSTLHSSYSQNPSSARRSLTCQHSTFHPWNPEHSSAGDPFSAASSISPSF